MKYDFETWQNRISQGSAKWLAMQQAKQDTGPDTVPLSVADMEFQLAPEIRDGLAAYLDTVVLGYTMPTPSYYAAVTGWLEKRQQLHVEAEWIELSPGVVQGIGVAVKALLAEGDGLIIMTPVYYPFYQIIEFTKTKKLGVELIDTDGYYTIDFARLEEAASDPDAKAILLCSPHNPVGRVWTEQELQEVGRIAAEHDLYVLSDEIHGDLIMPGNKFTSFLNACPNLMHKTMVFTAPSKTFNLAGMQASSVIIPDEELRRKFQDQQRSTGFFTLNALAFLSTELAYTRCDAWYEQMLQVIETNRNLATEYIEANIPGAVVTPLQGTYLLWVDLRCLHLDAKEMEKRMVAANLFLDEGYIFGDGGGGFERINLAAPTNVIRAAAERLAQVCTH